MGSPRGKNPNRARHGETGKLTPLVFRSASWWVGFLCTNTRMAIAGNYLALRGLELSWVQLCVVYKNYAASNAGKNVILQEFKKKMAFLFSLLTSELC